MCCHTVLVKTIMHGQHCLIPLVNRWWRQWFWEICPILFHHATESILSIWVLRRCGWADEARAEGCVAAIWPNSACGRFPTMWAQEVWRKGSSRTFPEVVPINCPRSSMSGWGCKVDRFETWSLHKEVVVSAGSVKKGGLEPTRNVFLRRLLQFKLLLLYLHNFRNLLLTRPKWVLGVSRNKYILSVQWNGWGGWIFHFYGVFYRTCLGQIVVIMANIKLHHRYIDDEKEWRAVQPLKSFKHVGSLVRLCFSLDGSS